MSGETVSGQGNARSEAVYTVSVGATLSGMHAQTLRQYDRLGLVIPGRTKGQGRRYSSADIERLRHIQRLTQEHGINLAGVQRVLDLEEDMRALRRQIDDLNDALSRAQTPVKGVFTADSTGKVQRRSHSGAIGRRLEDTSESRGVIAEPVRLPEVATNGVSRELAKMADGQYRGRSPVELSVRPGNALAERGLTGWQLIASLRLGQLARSRR